MKYSKDKIEFLDTLIYIDKKYNMQETLYKKPTDHQNYIHSKSAHSFSLEKGLDIAKSKINLHKHWGVWKTYEKLEKATNKERLSRNHGQWINSESNQPRQNGTFE